MNTEQWYALDCPPDSWLAEEIDCGFGHVITREQMVDHECDNLRAARERGRLLAEALGRVPEAERHDICAAEDVPVKQYAEPSVFTAGYLADEWRHARKTGMGPVAAWMSLGDRIAHQCMRQIATHGCEPHPADLALWQRVQRIVERHR